MRRTAASLIALLGLLSLAADKKKPPPPPIPPEPLTLKLGDPLSPRALVTRPPLLKGVLSWSVESRRHRGTFSCLALSPDGAHLATGGLDGTIRVWEVSTGKLLRALIGHGSYVYGLDWSPDGSVLASAGSFDATMRLWDAHSGQPLKVLKGHPSYLVQVAWAPNGRTIAGAGGESGIISHWDVATGKHLGKIELGRPIQSISWHPDGREIAAIAQTLPLQICSIDTYKTDRTIGDAKISFRCAAWAPDGKSLAAGTSDRTIVYDREGKVQRSFDGMGVAVVWDREGKRLAVSSTPTASIKVYEAASGNVIKTLAGVAHVLAFGAEGKSLVGGDFYAFTGYDIEAGKSTTRFEIAGTAPPLWWNGRPLVTGVGTTKLSLWDPATGKLLRTLEGHTGAISAVAWTPDGKTLATASYDKTVRLWEAASGKSLLNFIDHTGAVLAVAFSPDGKLVASAGADKKVLVWRVAGAVAHKFEGHTADVVSLAWGPAAGGWLASGSNDKTVRTWNTKTGQPGREFTETGETAALALAWSPDGRLLASGHYDDRVRLWQISTGKLIHELEERGSPPQVASLAWAGNDLMIASGRGNHTLQLWSPKTGQKLHSLPTMAPVQRVAFSSGLGTVVACNADRTARFFDTATGALRGVILAEEGQMVLVGADGHYRADNAGQDLIVVAQLEKAQETYAPAAFASKFKWQNSPGAIRLTPR